MGTYTVEIKFIDGEELIIDEVQSFGIQEDSDKYFVIKNGFKIFINSNEVKYIGRQFDLR